MAGGAQFAREMTRFFAPRTLWPEIARETAIFARRERDELIRARRFAPLYATFVNGVEDAAEETIRPGGAILYRARSLGAGVALAIAELRRRAPVVSGRYRDSFMVGVARGGVEGRAMPWDMFDPAQVSEDATEAFIYSPEPFSRKLDVQLIGARRLQVSAPAGFFKDAAATVRRRFPMLDAQRLYTVRHPAAERREDGRMIEYPAVVVREPTARA
jgi:hypothetical protein